MWTSPFAPYIQRRGYALIDGGLSTELERQGHNLDHALWSARLLAEEPHAIARAHGSFLEAGADCVISSSYQATPQGLMENGCSREEARVLIERSWALARDAVEVYAEEHPERPAPIAAASLGPYGAYLADGSEYRGAYGLSVEKLVSFHRERFEVLASVAPLFAIETVPCLEEAEAFRRLLEEVPESRAWVSFCCRDGGALASGESIEEAAALFEELPQVVAVGVNCTHPLHVTSLVKRLRATGTQKETIVYPNSGEPYCAETKSWAAASDGPSLAAAGPSWRAAGARLIGGCCRVGTHELGELHRALG